MVEKDKEEIRAQIEKVVVQISKGGTKWRSMTYEEGVGNALSWVIGDREEPPVEDD